MRQTVAYCGQLQRVAPSIVALLPLERPDLRRTLSSPADLMVSFILKL